MRSTVVAILDVICTSFLVLLISRYSLFTLLLCASQAVLAWCRSRSVVSRLTDLEVEWEAYEQQNAENHCADEVEARRSNNRAFIIRQPAAERTSAEQGDCEG